MKRIALALTLCLLSGCATIGLHVTPEAKNGTVAQGVLQQDVLRTLYIANYAGNPNCSSNTVTEVRLTKEPKEENDGTIRATEIWSVDNCGTTSHFEIEYNETPGQGTTFGIKPL